MQEVVTRPSLTAGILFCASSKCGYSDVLTATTTGDRRVATALLRYKRARLTVALLAFLLLFVTWWAVSATFYLFA